MLIFDLLAMYRLSVNQMTIHHLKFLNDICIKLNIIDIPNTKHLKLRVSLK